MEEYKLSHLKELEAESIHIIREVAAEFENPVMLYSIGMGYLICRNGLTIHIIVFHSHFILRKSSCFI